MMHGAPSSLSYSLHCTQHNYTTYTSDTIDQQHKTSNLKQVMQKMEVTNFRNFCLKNSGISGLGKKRNFRKSEFPELQSLSIAKQYKWIDGRQLSTQEIPPWMQVAVLYNIVSRGKKSCGQTHTHGLCEPIIAV